jgi:hypothetical protein
MPTQLTLEPQRVAVVVTGSRDWTDVQRIRRVLAELPPRSIVIHGAQRGADTIAGDVAKELGHEVEPYPVDDWRVENAGPARNARMISRLRELRRAGAECYVLAFPLPQSTGTPNCMRLARRARFEVIVY